MRNLAKLILGQVSKTLDYLIDEDYYETLDVCVTHTLWNFSVVMVNLQFSKYIECISTMCIYYMWHTLMHYTPMVSE